MKKTFKANQKISFIQFSIWCRHIDKTILRKKILCKISKQKTYDIPSFQLHLQDLVIFITIV